MGLAGEKIAKRDTVYKEAYARHPERWSGKTRNWAIKEAVFLNPPKCKTTTAKQQRRKKQQMQRSDQLLKRHVRLTATATCK